MLATVAAEPGRIRTPGAVLDGGRVPQERTRLRAIGAAREQEHEEQEPHGANHSRLAA